MYMPVSEIRGAGTGSGVRSRKARTRRKFGSCTYGEPQAVARSSHRVFDGESRCPNKHDHVLQGLMPLLSVTAKLRVSVRVDRRE